jgi:diaminohydroxyphosphoribosylaminopyrimidine deaminase/5-amino-6-(5-phosphoribosylamino)uracil reductase
MVMGTNLIHLLLQPMNPEFFMQRCIQLARLGAGYVAPNPLVGAVLVHENRIIGEGYHQQYGQAHAEVNCIASVKEADRPLISSSVLYVSLEPCAHFGKTPPCADLLIEQKIPKVVIGSRDPFEAVNGKGIERLKAAGIEVLSGILANECNELNKRFFTFHTKKRPYIILKWAQTKEGKIAGTDAQRLLISNAYSNKLVHQWRSEEAAILVGTNTAAADDPSLTNRLWNGPSPVRLVIDTALRLPETLQVFNRQVPTIIFNTRKQEEQQNLRYYKISSEEPLMPQLLHALYQLNIQSVLVEGGAKLLQSFIAAQLWDDARIITNTSLQIGEGLAAPVLTNAQKTGEQLLQADIIELFKPHTH